MLPLHSGKAGKEMMMHTLRSHTIAHACLAGGLLLSCCGALANSAGFAITAYPSGTLYVGRLFVGSDQFQAYQQLDGTFSGELQVLHQFRLTLDAPGPSAQTSWAWSLAARDAQAGSAPQTYAIAFARAGSYAHWVSSTGSITSCPTPQTCTSQGGSWGQPGKFGPGFLVEDAPDAFTGSSPKTPLKPDTVAPPPEFNPTPPGTSYSPTPFRFRTKTPSNGVRAIGIGLDPVYHDLPAGDAYVLQAAAGSAPFAAFVVPELPAGGMSLHLDSPGWQDQKLLPGMAYSLPVGTTTFALLGDPEHLVIGLLFDTQDVATIGSTYIASFSLAPVPEPAALLLMMLGLGVVTVRSRATFGQAEG